MKSFAIALLVISLLAGCASKPRYEQTSMKLRDGTTHYFLKPHFKPCQLSRDWANRTLTIRADEICKSGYTLVDTQTPVILEQLGEDPRKRELIWEIKCNAEEPKS